jgi:predicted RNase H-like HicB family nuclease
MNLTLETELEDDGRWLAEVLELAGVMAYGAMETEAITNGRSLGAAHVSRAWGLVAVD